MRAGAYHGGHARQAARGDAGGVHGRRRGRRDGRDDRLRHGRRQARRALRRPPRRQRVGRHLLPGGRPGGARRRAGRGDPLLPARGPGHAALLQASGRVDRAALDQVARGAARIGGADGRPGAIADELRPVEDARSPPRCTGWRRSTSRWCDDDGLRRAAPGVGRARRRRAGRGDRRGRAGRGATRELRPVTRGDDARLRRARRLPPRVRARVLRRGVRPAVRELRLAARRTRASTRPSPSRRTASRSARGSRTPSGARGRCPAASATRSRSCSTAWATGRSTRGSSPSGRCWSRA